MDYPIITRTDIPVFPLLSRGKVRDIYDIDDDTLLIVTTDRMSAFDVILDDPIPGKGVILNQLTLFWMKRFAHLVPNHIKETDIDRYPAELRPYREQLEGLSLIHICCGLWARPAVTVLWPCGLRCFLCWRRAVWSDWYWAGDCARGARVWRPKPRAWR